MRQSIFIERDVGTNFYLKLAFESVGHFDGNGIGTGSCGDPLRDIIKKCLDTSAVQTYASIRTEAELSCDDGDLL